ncbi:MAG TPA: HYR domain-containing protein [Cyclobacteriaceae bacterium]|nr:HYR domain-containing protein [Cyclobacteriaceae bacterium]
MNPRISTNGSNVFGTVAFYFVLMLNATNSFGQTGCACPAAGSCGPCTGGLTSLTIQYTGLGVTLTVNDGGGIIYTGTVLSGATITVHSSAGVDQLFVGNSVTVVGTLLFSETLATDCTDPVTPGTVYTYFEILSSTDKTSGPVCCAAADDDHVAPTFTTACPADVQVSTAGGACTADVSWTPPVATDNCGTVDLTSTKNPGDSFPIGTTLVTYTAKDQHNNSSTCSFNVKVIDDIAPFITSCPTSTNVSLDATCQYTIPAYTATVTDNCSGTTLTQTPAAGTVLSGNNTSQLVTLTATDAAGNTSSCSFTVTLKDDTAPSITSCPSGGNVSLDASCNYIIPTYTATVTDNCSGATLTQSPTAGTILTGHNTTQLITLTATDAAGNTSTCSFTITLKDDAGPSITSCPTNADVSLDATCSYTIPTYTATVTDNCSGATLTQSPAAGTVLSGHNTTQLVTLTATDGVGNTSTCSFTITLKDVTAPLITSCPSSANVSLGTSCNYIVPTYTATVTENCSGVTLTQFPAAGTVLSGHNTSQLVTLTAKDAAGNTSTCSFTITLNDDTAPSIASCATNTNVSLDTSCKYTIPNYSASITDNCSGATLTQSPTAGTVLSGHNTTQLITLTATDAAGNTSTCSFTITLKDNTGPSITSCPSNSTVSIDATCSYTIPTYAATVTDNCSGATLTQSPVAGTVLAGHNTKQLVTLTATDGVGNTSTCSFTITLKDVTAPLITSCPTNANVSLDTSCKYHLPAYTATVTDNCSGATLTQSPAAGTVLSGHNTSQLVTLTAKDAAGNTSTCSFTITLKDDTAPSIASCPTSANVSLNASCKYTIPTYSASVSDNCSGVTVTQSPIAGTILSGHNTTQLVTLTAKDAAGNTTTCSFTITLKDATAPVISGCPSNISVSAGASSCTAMVSWTPPTSSDNCSSSSLTSNHNPGESFPVGVTSVVYNASDAVGNSATCSFKVTVIENVPPVITGCSDIVLTAGSNGKAIANWTVKATDNCDPNPIITSSASSGSAFNVGTTLVTIQAKDVAGNTSSCSFNVTVKDTNPPQITGCTNLTLNAGSNCRAIASWNVTVTDNADATPTVSSTYASGSSFPLGTTTVSYTAKDDAGNTSNCSFTVVVKDQTAPVFKTCPSDITVTAGSSCTAIASWNAPTATDNCSTTTVTSNHTPGETFNFGTSLVTYSATDIAGNKSVCSFNVIVTDNNPPQFSNCPSDTTVDADEPSGMKVSWREPTTSVVGCGTLTVTTTNAPGSEFAVGTTRVTYTATRTDEATASCSFNVTVNYRDVAFKVDQLITPNGDGINDKLNVLSLDLFPENQVVIVDRWGGLIYSASGYNNQSVAWDGSSTNGKQVPSGTYFYTVSVLLHGKKVVKKGFVELVR